MAVIPCLTKLIAFYQRRGYRLMGENLPFPVNPILWMENGIQILPHNSG
jgi:hypothetical protein